MSGRKSKPHNLSSKFPRAQIENCISNRHAVTKCLIAVERGWCGLWATKKKMETGKTISTFFPMRLWSALNSFSATSNYSRQPASSISHTKDERRRSCRPKKVGSSSSRLPQLQLQLLFKVKTCWTLFTFEVLWNSCNSVIKSFYAPSIHLCGC